MDMPFYNKARQFPFTLMSERWLIILNLIDDKALLVHECPIYGVTPRLFAIRHPNTGMGCFASQDFSNGEPKGY